MKFLLDADVPRSIATNLISQGHDVIDIRDTNPPGTSDTQIYHLIKEQSRILITRDLDFSNILQYPPPSNAGIIVLRTYLLSVSEMVKIVEDIVTRFSSSELIGSLLIARKGYYRIRRP